MIEVFERTSGEGWINTADFRLPHARLRRVLVQWMNLPKIVGQHTLKAVYGDTKRWWQGRWQADIDGWHVTLDSRPDYSEALADSHDTRLHLFTHVMEIRRADNAEFEIDAAETLLECLRVTLSFAFGRWVAPVLPVGYDSAGSVVWETWSSPICDPATSVGSPAVYWGRPDDLVDLVARALAAFRDPAGPGNTRFQMCLAVQAAEAGFVEQRIMAVAPILEHIAWAGLVLTRRWTPREYGARYAEDRLRYILQQANVETAIDSTRLPALAKFAQADRLDGPTAVTRVRNRLIHPQTPQDQIYDHQGLVNDAWVLSRRYAVLLLLHSIGYAGEYIDPVQTTGWVGATLSVPWSVSAPSAAIPMPPVKVAARRPSSRPGKSPGH